MFEDLAQVFRATMFRVHEAAVKAARDPLQFEEASSRHSDEYWSRVWQHLEKGLERAGQELARPSPQS